VKHRTGNSVRLENHENAEQKPSRCLTEWSHRGGMKLVDIVNSDCYN